MRSGWYKSDNSTNLAFLNVDGDVQLTFGTTSATPIQIYSNNSERLRITSAGNVGIGTTSPSQLLHVNGHIVGNSLNIPSNTGSPPSGVTIHKPANNTMAFRTNSSERMRLTDTGLGIGNTVPGDFNSQARNLVIGGGSGDTGITIYSGSGSGDTGNIFFADGTSGSDQVRGGITYNHGDNSMNFRTNDGANRIYISSAGRVGIGETSPDTTFHVNGGTTVAKFERDSGTNGSLTIGFPSTRATFDASGDLSIKNGGTERVRFHSGGIISATQGIALGVGTASTASNVLDDYEEGTWTPVYKGGSTAGSSPSGGGTYTKIGNLVHVDFSLVNITSTGASGDAIVAGLPFVCNQTNSTRGSFGGGVRFYNHELTGTSRYVMNTFIDDGNSHISFIQSGDATPWTSLVVDNDSGMYIEGAITYRTDA
jgi:hypothetical protein